MPAHQLLIIDPSVPTLTLLKNALEAKNFRVATARDIDRAVELAAQTDPVLIIANTHLAELKPSEIYQQLAVNAGRDVPIVALSNYDTDQDRLAAKETGFAAFVSKPIQMRSLVATLHQVLQGRRNGERRESRHKVSIDVIIHILDERGRIVETEQTITENMSRQGACLLTLQSVEVGDTISVATFDNSFQSRAIVRGSFLGSDRIRRINIEFIDEKWQEESLARLE